VRGNALSLSPSRPFSLPAGCPLLASLLLAALLAAWLATAAAGPARCPVGAEDDLGCARGFEAREHDRRGDFRWTDGAATIRFPGAVGRSVVEARLAAPRPDGRPARVVLAANGVAAVAVAGPEIRHYRLLTPGALAGGPALTLLSDTFSAPGGSRLLGVQVYGAWAAPEGGLPLPDPLLALALLAVGLAVVAGPTWAGANPAFAPAHARWAPFAAIALLAGLWAWLPERVAPFLPALALLLGVAALVAARTNGLALLGYPPALLAVLGSAALDGLIVAQAIPRPWIAAALVGQAALTLWAVWQAARRPPSPIAALLLLAVAVRLLGFAARLLAAQAASDPDTPLFYTYGRAALAPSVPIVEYPSGALIPWMVLALPGSRELFVLLLPLLNLACDLVIVWGIWAIGDRRSGVGAENPHVPIATPQPLFPLFYALSPLLLPFWHGKYDPLPAALLVVGLALYARGGAGWAGAALGFGGAVKWVPWLAAPFLAWGLLRGDEGRTANGMGVEDRGSRSAEFAGPARFAIGLALAVAAASLPFALRDGGAFLAPYRVQGARPMIAESIWFPLATLLKPALLAAPAAPWSGVRGAPFGGGLMVGVQLAVLAGLGLAQALLPPDRRRTIGLAALAPVAFLLLNRVFSPQYVLIITAGALAAAAALAPRQPVLLLALLVGMQVTNLLVWPNTMPYWPAASGIMFGCALAALGWLTVMAMRPERSTDDGRRRRATQPDGQIAGPTSL
jgi:hypothetical protein